MKRILFAVFGVIVMLPMASMAVDCTMVDGQCPAGCYHFGMDCFACQAGYYNDKPGADECTACTIPEGATPNPDQTGLTSNNCGWTASCKSGEYVASTEDLSCQPCGDYYTAKGGEFTITGSGPGDNSIDIDDYEKSARCDGKVYKLILHSNGAPQIPDTQPLTKEGYFKYDGYAEGQAGFATSSDATVWYDYLPYALLYKDGPVRSFLGFFDKRPGTNDNATRYFSSNGSFIKTQSELVGLLDKDEIELYAGWQRDPYFIKYVYGNGTTSMETCGADNKECTTKYANSVENAPDGQTFTGVYKCYINYEDEENRQPCQTPEYKVDDPIAEPPNDDEKTRYFVAQYQVCPIGHYCDSNGQHECPGGTTTASTGTSSISGCVMRRGVSGTKFCDSTGNCFYIPASLLYNGAIPGR